MKRWAKGLLALGITIGGVLVASTPARLDYNPKSDEAPDLQSLLLEPQIDLIPGTEKRLLWHDEEQQTEWSVVALHGFSASRQESAPLAERVANKLGANLFEARFSGHGLQQNALVDISAEQWLDDVADALTVGRLIGKKIVVIAVSNGATLSLAMLDHPSMQFVDSLVLVSPNFGPVDPKSMWMTKPGGPLLLRLLAGTTRTWEAQNESQALYWTTTYPTAALIEVIRAVDRALEKIGTVIAPPMQIFYSPDDKVVSLPAMQTAFETIQSPQLEIIPIMEALPPSAHVIVGDIMAPANTLPMADQIEEFILHRAR